MLLLGVVQAQAAGDVSFGSFDLLETQVLTSSAASVTFSSLNTLAAGYQHLQLRIVGRDDRAAGSTSSDMIMRFNGDTATNYSAHRLEGNGSSVSSTAATSVGFMYVGGIVRGNFTANSFAASVIDILDPFETTKYTTVRSLNGLATTSNEIKLCSGNWRNTNALTSISITSEDTYNIVTGSRFSLYGIKAGS